MVSQSSSSRRGLEERVAGTRRAYEDAFESDTRQGVRRLVAESWDRTVAAGLKPGEPPPDIDITDLGDRQESHPLAPYLPVLRSLLIDGHEDAWRILAVTDMDGRVLWLDGSRAGRQRADRIGMQPGAAWTESRVGTNAIGTALVTGGPVEILAAEHFITTHHDWYCAAVPVTDPDTGRPIGIIDISGPYRLASIDTLPLVRTAGRTIEEMVRAEWNRRDAEVLTRLLERGIRREDALLVSPGGRQVWGASDLREGPASTLDIEAADWGYHILHRRAHHRTTHVRLRVLGPGAPTIEIGERTIQLTPRRAEILVLLAMHPEGMSAEQLAQEVYGDDGNAVAIRAEVFRIRKDLGGHLASAPYRFTTKVDMDAGHICDLLTHGRVLEAIAEYTGPMLPQATSLAVELARGELHESLRRAVLAAGLGELSAWCGNPAGQQDTEALRALIGGLPAQSAQIPLLEARLRRLERELG
ncbi:hypothetical protein GCM10009785_28310 [Brooklawnia cerclae]|uniref:OmpR/PhoB-type domain-containing protein n=1 Tax=Brooklawnia cerclae TaxID=349934 RepID=A0ABX0SEQ4_9ACTN|nr:helix-turn-helix domain-containing protein [Brooklawnia cerclae]NIH56878.1 hypothetical protein [Brooklawnia cerclae]